MLNNEENKIQPDEKVSLNFAKKDEHCFDLLSLKRKSLITIKKTQRELGNVSMPIPSTSSLKNLRVHLEGVKSVRLI